MKDGTSARLLVNGQRDHVDVIGKLLEKATRMECLVAFAKISAMNGLLTSLREALERGMVARFAIGLDFHLTEPAVLRQLLTLAQNNNLELYLSDSSATFHPKVYAFQHGNGSSVIIGSANFTQGGLCDNFEASAVIEDRNGAMMTTVVRHFDQLVEDEVLVLATKDRIDAYEREYIIHDVCRKVAKKRAQKAMCADGPNCATLTGILELMKNDNSELGFSRQRAIRKKNLHQAKEMLTNWVAVRSNADRGFLDRFESLIGQFHSGGLQRGKNWIAEHPRQFVAAVTDIMGRHDLPSGEAFAVLHGHFEHIRGAGINLLSEILHALDNKRYAVMNQNAVSGLVLAGVRKYPDRPNKQNVSADVYTRYCQDADAVRQELGLSNFTELDALFNYAYWD